MRRDKNIRTEVPRRDLRLEETGAGRSLLILPIAELLRLSLACFLKISYNMCRSEAGNISY